MGRAGAAPHCTALRCGGPRPLSFPSQAQRPPPCRRAPRGWLCVLRAFFSWWFGVGAPRPAACPATGIDEDAPGAEGVLAVQTRPPWPWAGLSPLAIQICLNSQWCHLVPVTLRAPRYSGAAPPGCRCLDFGLRRGLVGRSYLWRRRWPACIASSGAGGDGGQRSRKTSTGKIWVRDNDLHCAAWEPAWSEGFFCKPELRSCCNG